MFKTKRFLYFSIIFYVLGLLMFISKITNPEVENLNIYGAVLIVFGSLYLALYFKKIRKP
ncbi:MAG: hypothetical protein ABS68_00540 [Niastella sp. SCN 39-18]|nr:MAG: hypothetical protein ABS68_00540 [Niastella sp. SCN 39-18]OJW08467.1 MAG: hypothetical protein BGO53_13215 [Sphingobacteriales bacterium 39-19]